MTNTARKIINSALRKIEVLAAGETPEASEAQDALDELNAMISSWTIEGLRADFTTMEEFPVTPAARDYTMGVGGDFDTVRPEDIEYMFFKENDYEYNVRDYSLQTYNGYTNKEIKTRPEGAYISRDYPLITIKFSSIPDKNYLFNLYTRKPLESYTNLETEVNLGAGWADAFVWNLAIRLATEYGKIPSKRVDSMAENTKQTVGAVSIEPKTSISSLVFRQGSTYDINRGT